MRPLVAMWLAMLTVAVAADQPYLSTIHQRWNASDLVCTGNVSKPARTGITRRIDGRDRDQLAARVHIETCFKGALSEQAEIRVIGYALKSVKCRTVTSSPIAEPSC